MPLWSKNIPETKLFGVSTYDSKVTSPLGKTFAVILEVNLFDAHTVYGTYSRCLILDAVSLTY